MAFRVFVPHVLRLMYAFRRPIVARADAHSAIIPVTFQFYAFDPSPPADDTSDNQASFAAWQCVQVSWLCICTLLQPAMAAIYNLRSELVTAETLLSTSVSNRAIGHAHRYGWTGTQIQSNRKGKGASQTRDSLDTESSTRDLTSCKIMQTRTFQIEEHFAGDSGIELHETRHQSWSGKM